jgi:hypothetical protein
MKEVYRANITREYGQRLKQNSLDEFRRIFRQV